MSGRRFPALPSLRRSALSFLTVASLLLPNLIFPLGRARAQNGSAPYERPTLRSGEVNVLETEEKRPIVLGKVLDPSTGKELGPGEIAFGTSEDKKEKKERAIYVDDQNRLVAQKPTQNAHLFVRRIKGGAAIQIYEIRVIDKNKKPTIRFEPSSAVVTPGAAVKVTATVVEGGQPKPDAKVEWEVDEADKKYVDVYFGGGNDVAIIGKPTDPSAAATKPNRITLVARNRDSNVNERFPVVLEQIEFKPLDVRLEVMDSRTVKDLFGSVTDKHYYVAEVNLFNNLGEAQNNGAFAGESVVVSSESIEVGVSLEAKYVGKDKSVSEAERQWHPVRPAARDDQKKCGPDGQQPCVMALAATKGNTGCDDHPYLFRPYPYDMIANTVDRRDSRDWRSRVLLAAESLATMTGFITSVAVPSAGSILPTALEKFNSLLIPGFKEHFPSNKDAQRQNINSFVMKPTETVPFKGNLARVLLFPKDSFAGYLTKKEYMVRISGLCPDYFKVKTAVTRAGDRLPINSISGRVTDAAGAGIPDVMVVLSNGSGTDQSTQTNSAGDYNFPNLTAGAYTISADLKGCGDKLEKRINVTASTMGVDLIGKPALKVSGRVTDANGEAIKDASVELSGGPFLRTAKTDDEGRYAFVCVPKGSYELTATSGDLKSEPRKIPSLSSDAELDDIKLGPPESSEEEPPANDNTEDEKDDGQARRHASPARRESGALRQSPGRERRLRHGAAGSRRRLSRQRRWQRGQ